MYGLRIRELRAFEKLAEMPWEKAKATFQTRLCKSHRLRLQGGGKLEAGERQALLDEIGLCDDCEAGAPPIVVRAAAAYLIELRDNPDLTWEQYQDEADEARMDTVLGKAIAAAAAERVARASAGSTPDGDGPSSTGSRGSRSRVTKS